MNDLQSAVLLGALAQEALQPKRVDDLHAFFKRNPQAAAQVERFLGYGAQLTIGGSIEALIAGPQGWPQPNPLGFGAALQGEPPPSVAPTGPELGEPSGA